MKSAAALLAICLCQQACSPKPGLEIGDVPVSRSKLVQAVARPFKLTADTAETLQEEKLLRVYTRDPQLARRLVLNRVLEADDPELRLAIAELAAESGDELRHEDPDRAMALYLDSARVCYQPALEDVTKGLGAEDSREIAVYNHAVGRVIGLVRKKGLDLRSPRRYSGELGFHDLVLATGPGLVEPRIFDSLVPTDRIKVQGEGWDHIVQAGFGTSMVGHLAKTEELSRKDPMIPNSGFCFALNGTVRFTGNNRATLYLQDLTDSAEARIEGKTTLLAGDFTAPLAYLYNHRPEGGGPKALRALLRPADYSTSLRFYSLEPFDPDKIPLILVHGLMSDAETWLPFIDRVRNTPLVREKYQIIAFNYPTGTPIGQNAKELRDSLESFREFYDPDRSNPSMRKMIIVGHSMGGILSNMQIRDSGDRLVKMFIKEPMNDIDLDEEARQELRRLKELGTFEANPDITRAVFIAAPHRGSSFASNALGQFGASLIRTPFDAVDRLLGDVQIVDKLTDIAQKASHRPRNSVTSLRPDNPLLPTVLGLPLSPRVRLHSIIAQANEKAPKIKGTDRVVKYTSAHLEAVESEKIVLNANHTSVLKSEVMAGEMLRILYKHVGREYVSR